MLLRRIVFRCGHCRKVACANAQWSVGNAASIKCTRCRKEFKLPFDRTRDPKTGTYTTKIKALVDQYRLDEPTALSVTEGILSLSSGVSLCGCKVDEQGSSTRAVAASFAILALAIFGFFWNRRESVAAPQPVVAHHFSVPGGPPPEAEFPVHITPPDPIQIEEASSEELTQISGPNPRSVLIAFCDHKKNRGRLSAREIIPAVPPASGVRLGVMDDMDNLMVPVAVTIRRDRHTQRWVIGNGSNPIVPSALARMTPGSTRVPF